MENDDVLRNTEKWYDMTREEQIEHNFKRARRAYDLNKEKYYHNYEVTYIPWFSAMFQGIVRILIKFTKCQFLFVVPIRPHNEYVCSFNQRIG